MKPKESMGDYLLRARTKAGLTLKQLSKQTGLSSQFLHDLEHGRRSLRPAEWGRLIRALPYVTLEGMAFAAVARGAVTLDASKASFEQRCRVAALVVEHVKRMLP